MILIAIVAGLGEQNVVNARFWACLKLISKEIDKWMNTYD